MTTQRHKAAHLVGKVTFTDDGATFTLADIDSAGRTYWHKKGAGKKQFTLSNLWPYDDADELLWAIEATS
jgi:hypothetical protein